MCLEKKNVAALKISGASLLKANVTTLQHVILSIFEAESLKAFENIITCFICLENMPCSSWFKFSPLQKGEGEKALCRITKHRDGIRAPSRFLSPLILNVDLIVLMCCLIMVNTAPIYILSWWKKSCQPFLHTSACSAETPSGMNWRLCAIPLSEMENPAYDLCCLS